MSKYLNENSEWGKALQEPADFATLNNTDWVCLYLLYPVCLSVLPADFPLCFRPIMVPGPPYQTTLYTSCPTTAPPPTTIPHSPPPKTHWCPPCLWNPDKCVCVCVCVYDCVLLWPLSVSRIWITSPDQKGKCVWRWRVVLRLPWQQHHPSHGMMTLKSF